MQLRAVVLVGADQTFLRRLAAEFSSHDPRTHDHRLHFCDAGDVATRPIQAGDKSKRDRVTGNLKDSEIELKCVLTRCQFLAFPSKTIILGVIDLSDLIVETPEAVAERIRKALPYVSAERIVIAPDCV